MNDEKLQRIFVSILNKEEKYRSFFIYGKEIPINLLYQAYVVDYFDGDEIWSIKNRNPQIDCKSKGIKEAGIKVISWWRDIHGNLIRSNSLDHENYLKMYIEDNEKKIAEWFLIKGR